MRFALALAAILSLPAASDDLKSTFKDGKLTVTWPKNEDADQYHVFLVEPGSEKEIAKPGEATCSFDAERFKLYSLEVRARINKEDMVIVRGVAGAFPPYFKIGQFQLDCFGRETWRFEEDKVGEGHKGDVAIVRSMGGASMLTIRGLHGISAGVPEGFGKIDPTKRKELAEALEPGEVDLKETQPATNGFRLRSGEGGYVHIRVREFKNPRVTFEYVYVMRPEVDDILRELADSNPPKLAKEDEEKVRALADHLVSKDTNERLSASDGIVAKGASAANVIADLMKNHAEQEVRDRLETVLRKVWERAPQRLK
ncbi:MAG: hypothetical protein FD180_1067 [Planctomycetota bacterium]|nr:MAG: hypothetical protein FD180_1067 [Planctomycetota bacterium]